MPDEIKEGTARRGPSELRSEVLSVRLKPSTVEAITKLAHHEERSLADMLRLLIQDGYRVRTTKR